MADNHNNTVIQELNSYTCTLDGTSMISAGAGTGKTYNIQILVLREILKGIPIEKILVVTFTELATQELQNRIRKILQNALRVCDCLVRLRTYTRPELQKTSEGTALLNDKELRQVLPCFGLASTAGKSLPDDELPKSLEDIKTRKILLEAALRDFDDAPISTIHGFCYRMLKENTFESGLRYGLELRSSCKAIVKSLVCEFYREFCHAATSSRRFLLLKLLKYTPDAILADLKEILANADAKINWGDDIPSSNGTDGMADIMELEAIETHAIWDRFPQALKNVSDDELRTFCTETNCDHSKAIFYKQIGSEKWLLAAYDELKSGIELGNRPHVFTRTSESLTPNELTLRNAYMEAFFPASSETQTSETRSFPKDSIPDLLDRYRRIILRHAYSNVRRQLAHAKEEEGFMTFEDLLLTLKDKVACTSGAEFKKLIREKFDCVMIDEFQDTDQTQSAIFSKLFAENDENDKKRPLIMIGDEKQAIYKFRGGDVQTFKQMTDSAQHKYTLKKNFRSTPDFIKAMNDFWLDICEGRFFEQSDIIFDEISVGKDDEEEKKDDAHQDMEKCLVYIPDNRILNASELLSKCHIENKVDVFKELASEILELKRNYGKATRTREGAIAECKPIDFKDIAILVRTKTDVDEIRKTLRDSGIPSVFMQSQSIFRTDECKWMLDFIDAVLEPGNQGKALRLLASNLFAFSASQFKQINGNCLADFQSFLKEMNALWHRKSFFAMFTMFSNTTWEKQFAFGGRKTLPQTLENVAKNTPSMQIVQSADDAERSLSLLNQVAETLMKVSSERHLEPGALFAFLESKLRDNQSRKDFFGSNESAVKSTTEEEDDDEEYPVHLTTQDDAVQILTIHKSKGLEYPFVFLPNFTSEKSSPFRNSIYHDESDHDESKKKIRAVNIDYVDAATQEKCDSEAFAENKRLMYVAITRAKYFCRFIGTASSLSEENKELLAEYKMNGWEGLESEKKEQLFNLLSKWGEKKYRKLLEYFRNNLPEEMPQELFDELSSYSGNLSKEKKERLGNSIETCLKALPSELRPTQLDFLDDWSKRPDMLVPELSFTQTNQVGNGETTTSLEHAATETPRPSIHAEAMPAAFQPDSGSMPTSFSAISKGRKIDRRTAENDNALAIRDDDMETSSGLHSIIGDDDQEEKLQLEGPALTPYDERTPIFQFPGGVRTGTCWHEIMEHLDFAQWEGIPTQEAWNTVEKTLLHYSQLGTSTRTERADAFKKMLKAISVFPLEFPGEPNAFRLCDVPKTSTLREFGFTFMMRNGIDADALAELLDGNGIDVPEGWSHEIARQPLTGSIDFLLQEPKSHKFFILDWKTNIIGADAANFTQEGIAAEVHRRFYSLQCVLYALAFMQYFRQIKNSAAFPEDKREEYAKEAYDAFGGCADVFLRGLDSVKRIGVHYLKPSWKLLNELDKRIGVIFQSSECK